MQSLRDILIESEKRHVAVGHFNISDAATLKAIVAAACALNVPVMIGVSEGEREFLGVREAAALVVASREEGAPPIFLNADHTHSIEKIEEAARAGFDEVLFDGSKLPFDENIRQTKEAVMRAKAINPEIIVEGEIGYIGSASAILEEVPKDAALTTASFTTPEEAVRFVKETGVDVLSPAVGNMHGLLASMVSGDVFKRLDIARVAQIKAATGIYMTLHGGSGTAPEDVVGAVEAGMTIVHINTELRLAWRRGIEEGLKNPKEVAPYRILAPAIVNVQAIVTKYLKLFNRL